MRFFLIITFASLALNVFSQKKLEKEERVSSNDVPFEMEEFMLEAVPEESIKWYRNTDQDDISFKAKTKLGSYPYCFEFDEDGKLNDIAIEIDQSAIPPKARQTILKYLGQEFDAFSIKKTQLQLIGDEKELLEMIKTRKNSPDITHNYKIEVRSKTNKEKQEIEFLFSEEGFMVRKRLIQFDLSNNQGL